MRTGGIIFTSKLLFPVDCPDRNGIVFSREAAKEAVKALKGLPICTLPDGDCSGEKGGIIGCVTDVRNICEKGRYFEVIIEGSIFSGGTFDCACKRDENGVITDFTIAGLGVNYE